MHESSVIRYVNVMDYRRFILTGNSQFEILHSGSDSQAEEQRKIYNLTRMKSLHDR